MANPHYRIATTVTLRDTWTTDNVRAVINRAMHDRAAAVVDLDVYRLSGDYVGVVLTYDRAAGKAEALDVAHRIATRTGLVTDEVTVYRGRELIGSV